MHRWHFQRLLRWLLPVVLALAVMSVLIARQKARGLGLSFLDDRAYVNAVVADNLLTHATYGVDSAERMPATRDVLWQLLVALAGGLLNDPVSAAYLLGAMCAVVTLLMILRMARLLFPFPPFILYTVSILIFTPGFLPSAIAGTPVALATALVTAACLLHMEGLAGRRNPLPLLAAFMLGLAATLRVEYVLVWMVFLVHALVVNSAGGRERAPVVFLLFRWANGLLMALLCLIPLLAWNYSVIHIPWPQTPGAPFTMDIFAVKPPGEALAEILATIGGAIPASFGQMLRSGLLEGVVVRLLAVAGAFLIAILAFRQEVERPYTLILALLVLLPSMWAVVYPFAGWDAAAMVYPSFTPLLLVSATFFFFRLPFIIEGVYRKWKAGIPEAAGFKLSWMVVGSLLFVLLIGRMEVRVREGFDRLGEAQKARAVLAEYLQSANLTDGWVATDKPGWLAYQGRIHPLDVTGACSPAALACLDENGRMNLEKTAAWLREKKPRALIAWAPAYQALAALLPAEEVRLRDMAPAGGFPRIWKLDGLSGAR